MRGITPIIAIILLLLMTVAAAGAAYLWITMMQGSVSASAESGLQTQLQSMNRRIDISSVWYDTGKSEVCLIMKNQGTDLFTADQMQSLTFYVDNAAKDYNSSMTNAVLQSGEVVAVCLCNADNDGNAECKGPTHPDGYNYTLGSYADVRVEPPVGAGDTYSGFRQQ